MTILSDIPVDGGLVLTGVIDGIFLTSRYRGRGDAAGVWRRLFKIGVQRVTNRTTVLQSQTLEQQFLRGLVPDEYNEDDWTLKTISEVEDVPDVIRNVLEAHDEYLRQSGNPHHDEELQIGIESAE